MMPFDSTVCDTDLPSSQTEETRGMSTGRGISAAASTSFVGVLVVGVVPLVRPQRRRRRRQFFHIGYSRAPFLLAFLVFCLCPVEGLNTMKRPRRVWSPTSRSEETSRRFATTANPAGRAADGRGGDGRGGDRKSSSAEYRALQSYKRAQRSLYDMTKNIQDNLNFLDRKGGSVAPLPGVVGSNNNQYHDQAQHFRSTSTRPYKKLSGTRSLDRTTIHSASSAASRLSIPT
jgi:hypothetical protein